jgi:hypothetical protein
MTEYVPGTVLGLSSLRATEYASKPPPPLSEEAKKRAEYLKRYLDGGDAAKTGVSEQKKKKKRKRDKGYDGPALKLVDEDVDWRSIPSTSDTLPTFKATDDNDDDGALWR